MEKFIEGYDNKYSVTDDGRVFSHFFNKKKLMTPCINSCGYYLIGLHKNKKRTSHNVHRLVAITFLQKDENGKEINHIDGNKLNNHVSNLEWVTSSENSIHAFKLELRKGMQGENHPIAKLTVENVVKIKKLFINTHISSDIIAKSFGVSVSCVNNIRYNINWKHVTI